MDRSCHIVVGSSRQPVPSISTISEFPLPFVSLKQLLRSVLPKVLKFRGATAARRARPARGKILPDTNRNQTKRRGWAARQ